MVMEKIDEIKGKTLYSSNGIKLVGADSGYCYIIDEEKKEILFKHFSEGYEIIKDRSSLYFVERIRVK